ncbi:hypothetical protein EDD16DRAFT_1518596 [Pisolithus croceorrhizus]|nr:hypothetical protein EDD16DRAFT_1518596 [Pisolithus croceorrhizus]KAI6152799.1 hypothetical protein EDD17DRAFT_1513244 [Pisolithus thermaeus]
MPATYTVLVFVMGGNSGPWRMNVRGDTLQGYRILPNNNIFASDALVYSTEIRVRGSRFEVYFDQQQHLHDRCNAVYVFTTFRVRREAVRDALVWLRSNNPKYYGCIQISEEHLAYLPMDDVPIEIVSVIRQSDDTGIIDQEAEGYVPQDDDEGGFM